MLERRTWVTLALLLLPVALLVLGAEQFGVRLLERIAINLCISLTLVVGLQVFMGNSGILSFAHIGFMGVGAYASAVLSIPARMKGMALPDLYPIVAGIELSPYLAIALGGLVAAAVAALVSYPLMRLSDAAAVITSFALLVVLHTIMLHWSEVTNGPRTLFGLPPATDLPSRPASPPARSCSRCCSRNRAPACCCARATTRPRPPRSAPTSRSCAGARSC